MCYVLLHVLLLSYMVVYKLLVKGSQFEYFGFYRKRFILPSSFDNKTDKVKTGYFDSDKIQMIENVVIK